jgi:hypothetical protein
VPEREHRVDWTERLAKEMKGVGAPTYEATFDWADEFYRAVREAEAEDLIPSGSYTWAELFELHEYPSPVAVPVPESMFDEERDVRCRVVGDGFGELG